MNKEKKKKTVPNLRFPEFQDAEEWGEKKLGSVGEIITGKTPSTQDKDLWDGDILFVTPTDITEDNKYQVSTQRTIVKQIDTKTLPIGSIMYTCIASIGKIAITTRTSITNQQINSIVVHNEINNEYLYYALVNLTPYIKSKPATSTLPIINKSEFSNFIIKIPKPPEQQKIAATLSSLDDLIRAQIEKIQALQAHKKGLMQQLFPAEGERVPRVRFGEFREAGEWEEKKLGSVCRSFSGSTPDTTKKVFYGGTIPFIRSAEINKEETELFLTDEGLKNSSAKLVNKGDVLVALYGANSGDVAVAKIDGAINQAILCLKSEASNPFIYQFLSFKKDWIVSTYIQGGQGNLSGDIIKSISLLFPKPKEQQKIADCLSSLDDLITTQSQKLEALKAQKKGLMQQLFPNPNETEA